MGPYTEYVKRDGRSYMLPPGARLYIESRGSRPIIILADGTKIDT